MASLVACKSGDSITVATPWGEELNALVYAHDQTNSTLVLQMTNKRDELEFRLLNTEGLSVSVNAASTKAARVAKFPPFNEEQAREREEAAIAKAKAAAQKIGKGVTREAQQIFNSIELIYPQTRWEGSDIIVLNEVSVRAPYSSQDAHSLKGTQSKLLKIVKGIIDKEEGKPSPSKKE